MGSSSSHFDNKSLKDFLKMHNIEMYSTYNEGKSVAAERFIGTLDIFLNDLLIVKILKLKLIFLIMQQKLILKILLM